MSLSGPQVPAHLVPLMRYRDVGIASEWLCAAFGFEPNFAAKAPDGAVFYAELRLGDSMIMLGAAGQPSPEDVMGETGGAADPSQAQSCYVVLHDVDAHYDQAKRAGATITLDIKSDDIGGRGYSCRDLEGHIWNFGTYDPWKGQSKAPRSRVQTPKSSPPGLRAAMAITLAVSVISGWYIYGHIRSPGDGLTLERLRQALLGPRQPEGTLSTGGISRPGDTSEAQAANAAIFRAQRAMAVLKEELEQERRAKSEALDAATKAAANSDRAQADAARAKTEAEKAQATVAKARADAAKAQTDADKAAKAQAAQIEAARQEAGRAQAALAAAKTTMVEPQIPSSGPQPSATPPSAGPSATVIAELQDLQTARDAAAKSAAEAEAALSKERETKDAALRALADAGARIAALEVELKATKDDAAQLRRQRATSATRARVQPKKAQGNQPWPYSEW